MYMHAFIANQNKIQCHQSRSLFVTAERSICNAYAIRIDRKTISYRLQITQNRLICVYIYVCVCVYIHIYIYILQYELSVVSSSQRFILLSRKGGHHKNRITTVKNRKQTCSVPWENENLKICYSYAWYVQTCFLKINAKNSLIMEILDLGLTLLVIIQDIFKCAS